MQLQHPHLLLPDANLDAQVAFAPLPIFRVKYLQHKVKHPLNTEIVLKFVNGIIPSLNLHQEFLTLNPCSALPQLCEQGSRNFIK